MYDEPDVVKMLKEEEKLGKLQDNKNAYDELETMDDKPEENFDETKFFSNEKIVVNKIENTLDVNLDKYALVAEKTSDIVSLASFTLNPKFIYVNPSHKTILGYENDDLIGKPCLDFIHPEDKKKLIPVLKRYLGMRLRLAKDKSEYTAKLEYRLKDKSGNWHYLETTANTIGNEILFISKDVTERKKSEATLKESQEKYKRLFDSFPDLIIETDDKGNILAVNPMMAKGMGIPSEKVVGKNIFDILPKEIAEERAKIARKALEEMRNLESDDERAGRHFHNIYVPILHPDGQKTIQTIVRDTTDQKKAEATLKESEEKFRSLFNEAPSGIALVDKNGIIKEVNNSLLQILSIQKEEIIGKNFAQLAPAFGLDVRENITDFNNRLSEKPPKREFTFLNKNNSKTTIDTQSSLIKSGDEVIGVLYYIEDITERKRMEERLRETEERFRIAAETSNDVVYEWDLQHSIHWFGKIDEMLGYGLGEFPRTFDAWANLVHPEDKKRVEIAIRAHLDGRMPFAIEYRVRTKDGACRWWTARGAVARTPDGRPIRWIGTVTDITERKNAEKEVIESEGKLKRILDSSPDAITVTDLNGNIIECNQATSMIHGFKKEELIGKNALELFSPKDLERAKEGLKKTLELELVKNLEYTLITKDGREFPAELSACLIRDTSGNPLSFVAITKDITERKKAEEMLRLNEEKLRKLIDSSPDSITVSDLNGTIIDCNQAAVNMHGFSTKEDIIGKNSLEFFAPNDREKAMKQLKKTLELGSMKNVEYALLKKDGSEFPAEISASFIQDSSGKPLSFMGISKDISERKKTENELKESEEKYRNVVERASDGIVIVQDAIIKYVNPRAFNILGYSPTELIGTSMTEYIRPDELPKLVEYYKQRIAGEDIPKSYESVLVHKDGKEIDVEISGRTITYLGKPADMIMVHDIVERKKSEKDLKEKIEELEKYKKLTINRELKMMEMKKQIKESEQKLDGGCIA